jgi:hypothetical protein
MRELKRDKAAEKAAAAAEKAAPAEKNTPEKAAGEKSGPIEMR